MKCERYISKLQNLNEHLKKTNFSENIKVGQTYYKMNFIQLVL